MFQKLSLIILLSFLLSNIAQAQVVPDGIIFQAVAKDRNGNAANGRTIYAVVSILANQNIDSKVYTERFVLLSSADGVFTLVIGKGSRLSGAASLTDIPWDKSYYLNVKIAIAPSIENTVWQEEKEYLDLGISQFWSVPYAFYSSNSLSTESAKTLSSTLSSNKGGTGVDNKGKTFTYQNNMAVLGTGDLTITTTKASNITFPSTGTLSTLTGAEVLTNKTLESPRLTGLATTITPNIDSRDSTIATTLFVDSLLTIQLAQTASSLTDSLIKSILKIDSTLLTKINYTDSAAMLNDYLAALNNLRGTKLNALDTANLSNWKLNKSDTAAMLSNYLAALNNLRATKLNAADTSAMLSNYLAALNNLRGTKLNAADTLNLSQWKLNSADTILLSKRIDLKLDTSDFHLMISPYLTKMNGVSYADTTALLSNYLAGIIALNKDTSTLQERLNLRLAKGDTATMLSPYLSEVIDLRDKKLNKTDTAKILKTYLDGLIALNSDTATIQDRLLLRVSNGDTARILSPYLAELIRLGVNKLNKNDTSAILASHLAELIYLRATKLYASDSVSMLEKYRNNINFLLDENTALTSKLNPKENVINKSTNLVVDGGSDIKYPSVSAVKSYVDQSIYNNLTPDATSITKGKIQLAGDLDGTASAPIVISVGGSSASQINASTILANASTSSNIPNTIVKRDGSGNFNAGTITATLSGNATNVSGIVAGTNGGTGVDNTGKTITLGGNITTQGDFSLSGANALTFNTTNATNLYLPTTGTLATLLGTENLINKTINGVTPSSQASGFTLVGGSTSAKTLIVENDAKLSGTNTGDQTIILTGDVKGTSDASGSLTATLDVSGVAAGTYGTATHTPVFTVDDKGRVKAVTNTLITGVSTIGSQLESGKIIVGDFNNLAAKVSMAGDVTINNLGATTISNDAITDIKIKAGTINYNKIQNVSGSDKILGRISAGAGSVEEISTTGTGNVVRQESPTITGVPTVPTAAITSNDITIANTEFVKRAIGGINLSNITGVLSPTNGGTGVDNTGKTITLGGNITTQGDFSLWGENALTLNTTNATNLYLPTTGTLATINGAEYLNNKIINGVTPSSQASGFRLVGGSTSAKTLIVENDAILSGTNTGDQTIKLTGDVIGSGSGTFETALNSILTTPGLYGSATQSPTFTVDEKGRIINISNTLITGVSTIGSQLESGKIIVGDFNGLASKVSMAGDVTMSNLGITSISDNAITDQKIALGAVKFNKIQDISGPNKILGRISAGAGSVEEISTTGTGNVVRQVSPTITGVPTVPTAGITSNDITIANTEFVKRAIGGLNLSNITGVLSPTNGGTGVDNTGKTITLGGNITTQGDFSLSGANALTFNTTNATNLNLPTTGTLATLLGTENLINKTINGVTPSSQASGFTLVGGSTSAKTLIVENDAKLSGTNTGDQTIILTGDVKGTSDASGSLTATLDVSGVAAGTYGTATHTPVFTVDDKGRVKAVTNTLITGVSTIGSQLESGKIIVGDFNGLASKVSMAGDVTINNLGATTISNDAITDQKIALGAVKFNKIQDISGPNKILGRISAGAGSVEEISTTGTGNVVRQVSPTITGVPTVPTAGITSNDITIANTEFVKRAIGGLNLSNITGVLSPTNGGTGVDNTGKTITLGGNITTQGDFSLSGANALTFNTTNATNLNLPTTGTLATLLGTENLINKTINGVTPSSQASGFRLVGGSTSVKTLIVENDAILSGTNTGDQTITLIGDVRGTSDASGSLTATLDVSGVAAGTYGTATHTPVFTVDDKGRVKAVTNTLITGVSTIGSQLESGKIIVGDFNGLASKVSMAGDVTINNLGTTTISNDAITDIKIKAGTINYNKIQNVSGSDKILGRISAGAGSVEEISTTGTGNVVRQESPTITGVPTVPTAAITSNDITIANTEFVKRAIGGLNLSNITGVLSPTNGGTGVDNTGKKITLGGNFQTTGTEGLVFNTSGLTSLDLPTRGTLATTEQLAAIAGGNFSGGQITGVISPLNGGTGIPNDISKTITLGGAFVTEGAFKTTLRSTANTDITLPITGTIATLAGSETLTNKTISASDNTIQNITNANISSTAGIKDTKLDNITTAGKVANTATTATSVNTSNAIVARDANGDFSARIVSGSLNGNASTATKLANVNSIYGNDFDGSANLTQVISAQYGGTGNAYVKFLGASSTIKNYTLPDADATILTTNTQVTTAQGGTGVSTAAANLVFAGPVSGTTTAPSFRALVASDLPSGSSQYINNSTLTQNDAYFNISGSGVLGGTVTASAFGIPGGTSNQFLKANGTIDANVYATINGSEFLTNKTINGLSLTPLTTGFSIAGGTSSKLLNVLDAASISGTNTGDVNLSGENYLVLSNQSLTANPIDLSGTNVSGTLAAARFPGLSGDVTNSIGSLTTTIANDAITTNKITNKAVNFSKMQDISLKTLLGNSSAIGAGSIQEIKIGSGLTLNDQTLSATGTGGTVTNVSASGPIKVSNGGTTPEISIDKASTSLDGYLSSTDWNTFNSKQPLISGTGFVKSNGSTLSFDNSNYLSGTVAISNGGTGATDITTARANLGLAIGTDVLAQRSFGTAANSKVEDFSPVAGSTSLTTLGTIGTGVWRGTTIDDDKITSSSVWNAKENALSFIAPLSRSINNDISIPVANATTSGYLNTTDWNTFNNKQSAISLTTTGTSGPATFSGNTINIPQYTGGGTVTSVAAITLSSSGTEFASTVVDGTTTPVITLNIPDASGSARGVVTSGAQTLGGVKTFTAAPVFSTTTAGSLLFAGTSGSLSQNNANLFWDNTNRRLGLGTTTPGNLLHVLGTSKLEGQSTIAGTTSATTGLAQGLIVTPTLTAAANNDALIGMDINPTYTAGGFTGVRTVGARIKGRLTLSSTTSVLNPYDFDAFVDVDDLSGTYHALYIACATAVGGRVYIGTSTKNAYALNMKYVTYGIENLTSLGMNGAINFGGSSHTISRPDNYTLKFLNSNTAGSFKWEGVSSNEMMRLNNTTASLMLQNGGTYTDNLAGLQLNHTITATAGIARGMSVTPTLTAASNSDLLIGMDINPTFTTGVYSATTNTIGLRVQGMTIGIGNGGISSNTVVGFGSLSKNLYGGSNTAVGYNAMSKVTGEFGSGSKGWWNTAVGSNALYSNVLSAFNTAVGSGALFANIANSNTAVGTNALTSNTTGAENTSVGSNSLIGLSSGSNNIGIGSASGRFISGGVTGLTSASNSIFIGTNAFPLADAQTNQIVIGFGAVGLGSNSTVIGNSSTTNAQIFGTLQTQGNKLAIAAKTAAYTINATDQIITGDASSAAFTVSLPSAVARDGQTFTIKKIDNSANAVTVGTTSSQTIDGNITFTLSARYKYVTVVSDGANWMIVGGN